MGDRNTIDMDIDQQGQDRIHPDPRFYMGNNAAYQHPNMYSVMPAPGNASNMDLRHFPNNHDGNVFYGNQVNGFRQINPVSNMNLGASSSHHNPCMAPPSGSLVIGMPRVSSDQLPSMGHHGAVGVGVSEFGMNRHFTDGLRNSSKRKNAETVPGTYQTNGSASSSTSALGMPSLSIGQPQSVEQHESRPSGPDAPAPVPPPPPPEHRVNGGLQGGRSGRSVRSRSNTLGLQMEPPVIHNVNHLVPATYMSQHFQPTAWAEQQPVQTGNDGSTAAWNYTPAMPYFNGGSVNAGSVTRNSSIILNPSVQPRQHLPSHPIPHHMHSSPPGMQPVHFHQNFHLHQQMPFRQAANLLPRGTTVHSVDDSEITQRVFPSYDLRLYRPHRNGVYQPVQGNEVRPHMRFLTVDEVAILEGIVENSIDRHWDMRLDIDDMSYEELLALSEQIGNVVTGLPEETLGSRLKTRAYVKEDSTQETENCIVCQVEYKTDEMIGTLECGHEYHVDCIKRWLQVKNVCPICKLPAFNVEDDRRTAENPRAP